MPGLPAYQGQKRYVLLSDWASLRSGNAEVTLSLSALGRMESVVVSFPCIRNLQSARCAEF